MLLGAAAALAGCSASDPAAVFRRDVVPVLESTCAASTCHGVAPGAEEAGEVIDRSQLFFDLNEAGRIADVAAARETAREAIDTSAPLLSTLLRKPLSESWGGLPHHGGENLPSLEDEAARILLDWIALEKDGGEVAPPLNALEQQFASEVQPLLFSMSCATGGCHGLSAAIPYHLDGGVQGEVSAGVTRENYTQSRRMLALGGDPSQSRLLRKSLPLHEGGIVHKGGNSTFLTRRDDPRAAPIVAWACAERAAATGQGCLADDEPAARGVVFVRGPLAPGDPFDLDSFSPGGDLFFAPFLDAELTPGQPVNLTAELHDGPADIRDPDVDASGRFVVFAMRPTAAQGHSLWTLDLQSGDAEQLTQAPGLLPDGGIATDRDPTWAPDGSVWFASTRAGVLAHAGRFEDSDLFEVEVATGAVARRTWTPHAERTPTFLAVGKTAGEVLFSTLRDAVQDRAAGHLFRFPPDLHVEYHVHFGLTATEDLLLAPREMPDGRHAVVLGSLHGAWDAGRIGVIERNFGPELRGRAAAEPSLPFYAPPLRRLDPGARSDGVTPRLVREVAPLADGQLLASVADGPLDLADPDADFDLRIEVLTLAEAPDGSGPQIDERRTLWDAPGVHDYDPQPVAARWPGPAQGRLDLNSATGTFIHNGLPMNDALLRRPEPAGDKGLETARFDDVRLVEALPLPPNARVPVPSNELRDGQLTATSTGIGSHPPSRVLAELPVAPDGSFAVDLPVGVPFRVQGLGGDGWASGAMHNRWYDVSPGQVIKQGVNHRNPTFYAAQCGACHGGLDGAPERVFIAPDVMTTATVTLSRFEGGDPRRPAALPVAGDATRRAIDFNRDIAPMLAPCAGCHGGAEPAAGLSLTDTPTTWFSDAYESLLASGEGSRGGYALVDASTPSAAGSYLIERLAGRELEAPRGLAAGAGPHGDLSDEEIGLLATWIDLGATWRGLPEGSP